MTDSSLSRFLLLPGLELLKCYHYNRAQVFEVRKIPTPFEVCPRCATKATATYDHRTVTIKDEPLRRADCLLKIIKRRLYCQQCRKPFTEPVDGIFPKRRTTQRFRRAVLKAAEKFSDLKKVIEHFHCSTSFIYRAVFEQLELKLREYDYPWPRVIGIDEHFFRRQNDHREYFTVFVDIKNHRLREAVLGKKLETVQKSISHIEGPGNVRFAVMDLSTTYRKLVHHYFPNAEIVADKFHVVRLLSRAIRHRRHQTNLHNSSHHPPLRVLLKNRRDLEYSTVTKI